MDTAKENGANGNGAVDCDVVVVGAGFGGLNSIHHLLQQGRSVRAFEAGSEVGGTWFWNKYPGARVDIESLEYSYGFNEDVQQEWKWPMLYSEQPAVLEYLNWVCDKLDLRRHIEFDTRGDRGAVRRVRQRLDRRDRQGRDGALPPLRDGARLPLGPLHP